jgi:hypothetical protein
MSYVGHYFMWIKKQELVNDPKVGCYLPSNLIELIKTDISLEKDLEKVSKWIWVKWACGHVIL